MVSGNYIIQKIHIILVRTQALASIFGVQFDLNIEFVYREKKRENKV